MKVYPIYFLDADETLFDFKRSEAESIRRCLLSFDLPADEETVFLYHTINDRLWKALERGEVDQKTLRVRRFEELLNTLGATVSPAEAAKRYSEELSSCAYLLPDAEEVCKALSQRATLYLTTNGIAQIQRRRFSLSPLTPYFEDLFISEELGVAKPNPAYFVRAMETIGARKKDILVVGDSLTSDIRGANAAGLDCCWFCPKQQSSSGEEHPTMKITSLLELL